MVLGDYRKQLRETLSGWQVSLSPTSNVVIAVFDAATSGRLSLTYFNELLASDFLERLYGWDTSCCWINGSFGIQSPSLYEMIVRAYGTWRQTAWKLDDGILRQQMQRMVNCRISKAAFPLDFKTMLVQRATRLHLLPKKERETLLFVTCAAIRKYHNDLTGEEYSMALDINNTDRSYLFGRLLAIAEAIEKSAYRQETERETNAMRMQCIFSQRPMYTWRVLEERLNPYYARLSPGLREYYRQRIQEIVDKLPLDDVNLNRKLDDTYLIGYYHQRAYRKNNNIEAEKSEIIDLGEE